MLNLNKVWKIMVYCLLFLPMTNVFAGNTLTKTSSCSSQSTSRQNGDAYGIFLIGSPSTHTKGLENLRDHLRTILNQRNIRSNIHIIYPYTNDNDVILDDLGIEGANRIIQEMERFAAGTMQKYTSEELNASSCQERYTNAAYFPYLHQKYCEDDTCTEKTCAKEYKNFLKTFTGHQQENALRYACSKMNHPQKILKYLKMNLSYEIQERLNSQNLIIIAHGSVGKAAVCAAKLLPQSYKHYLKDLILIGAPCMRTPNLITSADKPFFVYDLTDTITNQGGFGKFDSFETHKLELTNPNKTNSVILTKKHEQKKTSVNIFKSGGTREETQNLEINRDEGSSRAQIRMSRSTARDGHLDATGILMSTTSVPAAIPAQIQVENYHEQSIEGTMIEEPLVDINNCYFFKDRKYMNGDGKHNLERTVELFCDKLFLPDHILLDLFDKLDSKIKPGSIANDDESGSKGYIFDYLQSLGLDLSYNEDDSKLSQEMMDIRQSLDSI